MSFQDIEYRVTLSASLGYFLNLLLMLCLDSLVFSFNLFTLTLIRIRLLKSSTTLICRWSLWKSANNRGKAFSIILVCTDLSSVSHLIVIYGLLVTSRCSLGCCRCRLRASGISTCSRMGTWGVFSLGRGSWWRRGATNRGLLANIWNWGLCSLLCSFCHHNIFSKLSLMIQGCNRSRSGIGNMLGLHRGHHLLFFSLLLLSLNCSLSL
jgi:hypothetical protein